MTAQFLRSNGLRLFRCTMLRQSLQSLGVIVIPAALGHTSSLHISCQMLQVVLFDAFIVALLIHGSLLHLDKSLDLLCADNFLLASRQCSGVIPSLSHGGFFTGVSAWSQVWLYFPIVVVGPAKCSQCCLLHSLDIF